MYQAWYCLVPTTTPGKKKNRKVASIQTKRAQMFGKKTRTTLKPSTTLCYTVNWTKNPSGRDIQPIFHCTFFFNTLHIVWKVAFIHRCIPKMASTLSKICRWFQLEFWQWGCGAVGDVLRSGFFFFHSGEQGCMATVRSAMCCLVWSHILQQVFYAERETRRFCRDEVSGWLLSSAEKTFSSVYVCAKWVCLCECVCVCVCVRMCMCLWCSHRGASQQIISPLWQGFPAWGGGGGGNMKHFILARFEAFQTDKWGLGVLE